jgi:hypothetical protein
LDPSSTNLPDKLIATTSLREHLLPTMTLNFLLIGIAWDQYEKLAGADKAEETIAWVKAALSRDEAQFKEAGLGYQFLDYGPGESMDRLIKVLEEREWSGVCM